jgi:hypothetical protein
MRNCCFVGSSESTEVVLHDGLSHKCPAECPLSFCINLTYTTAMQSKAEIHLPSRPQQPARAQREKEEKQESTDCEGRAQHSNCYIHFSWVLLYTALDDCYFAWTDKTRAFCFRWGTEPGIPFKWTSHFKGLADLLLRVSSLSFSQRCSSWFHSSEKRHGFIEQLDPEVSRQRVVPIVKSRKGLAPAYFKSYGSLNMRQPSGLERSRLHYPLWQRHIA